MKVPNFEAMIEEVEEPELNRVFTRLSIFESIRDHFEARKTQFVRANDIYDYVKWVCSFSTKVSHTKIFSDICSVYYQLGNTAEDVPAKYGKEPFTSLYLRGVMEALDYSIRKARGD